MRPVLVAHVEDLDAGLGSEHAGRADAGARVGLHAEEVVAAGGFEVDVLVLRAELVDPVLVTRLGGPVAHRERQADRVVAGAPFERVVGAPVRIHEHVGRPGVAVEVVGPAGREHAHEVPHERHDVRLVDGAGHADAVAEVGARPLAEAGEALRRSTGFVQPPCAASQRGVVKWWKVTTGSRPRSRQASTMRR